MRCDFPLRVLMRMRNEQPIKGQQWRIIIKSPPLVGRNEVGNKCLNTPPHPPHQGEGIVVDFLF
jgi:hypothetical protein